MKYQEWKKWQEDGAPSDIKAWRESKAPKPTVGHTWSDKAKTMIGEENLREYDTPNKPNKYAPDDPRWGTEPGEYTVYRSGSTDRGMVFTGESFKGVEDYTDLYGETDKDARLAVNSYTVSIKKPYVSESMPTTYKALFGKDVNLNSAKVVGDAWVKADNRIAAALKKKGYDAWLMTSPAPPAKKELVILGNNPMKETSRIIPDAMHKKIEKHAAEDGFFANSYVNNRKTMSFEEWWKSDKYKEGKAQGKWN
jgi:hypothetical protein